MPLTIETVPMFSGARVRVVGEVDVSCADELREAISAAVAGGASTVEVDLSEVPYIDSTGIGVLVGAAHRAVDAGRSFVVSHPQRNVARVLGMLGLDEELGIEAAADGASGQ